MAQTNAATLIAAKTGKIQFSFENICALTDVDAIVNAANTRLLAGGGVCGAIFQAAGRRVLQEECNQIGFCPVGSAVITSGVNLPMRIIHAVGPSDGSPAMLEKAYKSIMDLCKKENVRSVAIPCISTGIFGFDNKKAARIAIETIKAWLEDGDNSDAVDKILLVLFTDQDIAAYAALVPTLFPQAE
ncbi:Macro domain [Carpediemonas membranifera]|uniref:Macro domain n=1 Tax=Carpediemonas membranifera TaxID=201153 RepID=A0A8J6B6W6_9EUKA|nr:Macro domain [Carpediemonas membranifera]|eukprot:KAG9396918.1 Macro domain [Carpediemonas membranifera]